MTWRGMSARTLYVLYVLLVLAWILGFIVGRLV